MVSSMNTSLEFLRQECQTLKTGTFIAWKILCRSSHWLKSGGSQHGLDNISMRFDDWCVLLGMLFCLTVSLSNKSSTFFIFFLSFWNWQTAHYSWPKLNIKKSVSFNMGISMKTSFFIFLHPSEISVVTIGFWLF